MATDPQNPFPGAGLRARAARRYARTTAIHPAAELGALAHPWWTGEIVKTAGTEGGLVFPAASVAMAMRVWRPFPRSVSGVKLQVPSPVASVVPKDTPSSMRVTVLRASAVPVMGGRGLWVSVPWAGVTTPGAGGATVSTVKERGPEGWLVLPAALVAWAVTS